MTAVATRELVISVRGEPIPQGSMKCVGVHRGIHRLLPSNKADLMPWRDTVAKAAKSAANLAGAAPFDEPVHLDVDFFLTRPPSVSKRRIWPAVKPDLDKLLRGLNDALEASGVLAGDSRVVTITAAKHYAQRQPGARITIRPVERTTP